MIWRPGWNPQALTLTHVLFIFAHNSFAESPSLFVLQCPPNSADRLKDDPLSAASRHKPWCLMCAVCRCIFTHFVCFPDPKSSCHISFSFLFQSIFVQYDEDSSGTMSPFEFSVALDAVGMHTTLHMEKQAEFTCLIIRLFPGMKCDSSVMQLLSERFVTGELHMPFHCFVSCITRLRKLFGNIRSLTKA